MKKMILATGNAGKLAEFQAFLAPMGIEVIGLKDLEDVPEIVEDGATFEENATIKAQIISDYYHLPVVAEDTGLMIDALHGEPGVYSARYAGDHDDAANNNKVLEKMVDVPDGQRQASFKTVLVALRPEGEKLVVEGKVTGEIMTERRGEGGFGYDALFYYPEFDKTFAEMTVEEKNQISHRGRALKNFVAELPSWWEV